jgi:hypothetical protein
MYKKRIWKCQKFDKNAFSVRPQRFLKIEHFLACVQRQKTCLAHSHIGTSKFPAKKNIGTSELSSLHKPQNFILRKPLCATSNV